MTARLGGICVALVLGLAGCRHCSSPSMYAPGPRLPFPPSASVGTVLVPPRPGNCQNGHRPFNPIVPQPQPPGVGPSFGQPLPPNPPSQSYFPQWQPSISLQAPEPATGPDPNGYPKLFAPEPETGQSNLLQPPSGPETKPPPPARKPDVSPDRPPVSPLPVGIPGFAEVRKGISNGLRPNSLDGLDWLAGSGYKTVLHLHEPGQDDAADRKQFESRGMRFISLAVSPETLTPDLVERFNQTVADLAGQPLFVYDRDGLLTGGLWYLHFRLVEKIPDQEALDRAGRLGLRIDPNGPHQAMILAVQKYLSLYNK